MKGVAGTVAALTAIAAVAVVTTAAWWLAYPHGAPGISLAVTLVRAAADCAAVTTLGLAVVPALDTGRFSAELARRATVPLTWAGAVWALTETMRLVAETAQAAALPLSRLPLHTTVEYALHTAAGRSGLAGVLAGAAVCLTAAAADLSPALGPVVFGALAAAGLAARTASGHLADSPIAAVGLALHVLAAGLWCGSLVALTLLVRHRGQWARVLPRFSRLSLPCVAALVLGGVLGAVTRFDAIAQLYATGYGRVLLSKIILTAVLTVLAWRNRVHWLPAARAHRASAGRSQARSRTELALMAVALTLAAALAVTG